MTQLLTWRSTLGLPSTASLFPFYASSPPTCYIPLRWYAAGLAPRRTKYRTAQKSRPPVPITSTAGTTLVFGRFGLRVLQSTRISAAQLGAVTTAIKRKLRVHKGSKIWLRVFPDIPVSRKGNEVRMGKGKGSFEYWACRIGRGRVLLEIDGEGLKVELAKEAIRLARDRLGFPTEFIIKKDVAPLLAATTTTTMTEEDSLKVLLPKEKEQ